MDGECAILRARLAALEHELEHSRRLALLGTLASSIAHEFNNLLGGILGCVGTARAENRDASVGEDLEMIGRTADRGDHRIVEIAVNFTDGPIDDAVSEGQVLGGTALPGVEVVGTRLGPDEARIVAVG